MVKKRGATMDRSQRDKFVDKALEIGADEDEAAFDEALKRIVPPKRGIEKKPPDK